MPASPQKLATRLDEFLENLPVAQLASEIAKQTNGNTVTIESMLDTYINEARISFALIENHLDQQARILEVGAGLCLLSLFLKQEGYTIIALEPALGGFGAFDVAKKVILDHFDDIQLDLLTCAAQDLDPARHGAFDLVFSNNVIEHIPDWKAAMKGMQSVLSIDGSMRHSCPNYTVPYEPHYGIPVFRRFPKLSRRLFLSPEADPEIWDSLNFINSTQVKNYCSQNNLTCDFEKEMLYRAFMRIYTDPVFKERHRGLITIMANIFMTPPLKQLIRHLPATVATPMVFSIKHCHSQTGKI